MMKPKTAAAWILGGIANLTASMPALAHPGDHGTLNAFEAVGHLAEPFHLGLIALAVVLAGGAIWAVRSRSLRRQDARRRRNGQ